MTRPVPGSTPGQRALLRPPPSILPIAADVGQDGVEFLLGFGIETTGDKGAHGQADLS